MYQGVEMTQEIVEVATWYFCTCNTFPFSGAQEPVHMLPSLVDNSIGSTVLAECPTELVIQPRLLHTDPTACIFMSKESVWVALALYHFDDILDAGPSFGLP